jgi:hypothetical protein
VSNECGFANPDKAFSTKLVGIAQFLNHMRNSLLSSARNAIEDLTSKYFVYFLILDSQQSKIN